MYPTISDLLKDLFGINIPLPIQSFGFFVAISFLLAAWILTLELKRKERQGLLSQTTRKVLVGAPATKAELIASVLIGFIIGYKLIYFALNYSSLVGNPQEALLSSKGSLIGGILIAAVSVWMKYSEKNKTKQKKPEWVEEIVYPHQLVGNITMLAAVAGLFGAKIFDGLERPEQFISELLNPFSGLAMYGGVIVGGVALIWYGKKNGIPPLHMCDANAAGVMLAYGFGRIGCQVAGDGDWGIANTAPKPSAISFLPDWFWAYRYPHNVINEGIPIPGCVGNHCSILELPVFPTPLYESIVCIALFFVLWSVRKKFSVPGAFFSLYILMNGVERFCIELIRVNSKYNINGLQVTQAQIISFLLILGGATGLILLRKKPVREPQHLN